MNGRMSQGWRVEIPVGRHSDRIVYHEYYRGLSFRRIVTVDGSLVIFFGTPSRWAKYYPWAALRRDEILTRIAQTLIAPGWVADIRDDGSYMLVRKQSP